MEDNDPSVNADSISEEASEKEEESSKKIVTRKIKAYSDSKEEEKRKQEYRAFNCRQRNWCRYCWEQ